MMKWLARHPFGAGIGNVFLNYGFWAAVAIAAVVLFKKFKR